MARPAGGVSRVPSDDVDWLLFCDGDGSDDLGVLPSFLRSAQSVDLVIGNRLAKASAREALTTVQRFGNRLAVSLIRLGWGAHFGDLAPLRLIRHRAFEILATP